MDLVEHRLGSMDSGTLPSVLLTHCSCVTMGEPLNLSEPAKGSKCNLLSRLPGRLTKAKPETSMNEVLGKPWGST